MERMMRPKYVGQAFASAVLSWTSFRSRTGADSPGIDEKMAFSSGFDYGVGSCWPVLKAAMQVFFVLGIIAGLGIAIIFSTIFVA